MNDARLVRGVHARAHRQHDVRHAAKREGSTFDGRR